MPSDESQLGEFIMGKTRPVTEPRCIPGDDYFDHPKDPRRIRWFSGHLGRQFEKPLNAFPR